MTTKVANWSSLPCAGPTRPSGQCDRINERLESKSSRSPGSKLIAGNCVSDDRERNRKGPHMVVFGRITQNSA
jgi:hypothetical protein